MLDMREDERPLLEASRHRPGYVERQNGPWDDRFLCKRHEDEAGGGDEYAVRLSRRLHEAKRHPEGEAWIIDNPRPELLARYAYGVVWRHVAAPISAPSQLRLGPYRERMEASLFGNGAFDLPFLVSVSNLTGKGGRRVPMGLAPYRMKFMECWSWHFISGYLDIILKTDQRHWPKQIEPYLGNMTRLTLFEAEPADIATVPFLRELTDRVRAAPYRGRT